MLGCYALAEDETVELLDDELEGERYVLSPCYKLTRVARCEILFQR